MSPARREGAETPSPFDLLKWRSTTAADIRRGVFYGVAATKGDNPVKRMQADQAAALARALPQAVAFWWEPEILRMALESPLPPGYVTPAPPFPVCWFVWPGSDPGMIAHLTIARKETLPELPRIGNIENRLAAGVLVAPMDYMTENYPGFDVDTIVQKMLIFLDSRYVAAKPREMYGNSAARRLRALGADAGDARYVELRAPAPKPREDVEYIPERHIQYRHAFMVRGHYRNQWYASQGVHKTIWIASFIKAADKPLREAVYRVGR